MKGRQPLVPVIDRRTFGERTDSQAFPRSAAMKMVGDKAESCYRRYAIVGETMLQAGRVVSL